MAIRPGTLSTFNGSMAHAIEIELNTLLAVAGMSPLPTGAPERDVHRRMLVAIARGVVAHLKANEADLDVHYNADGSNKTTHVTLDVSMS